MTDTIFALASAPGRAGVAVIRISGPATAAILEAVMGKDLPAPRRAHLAALKTASGEVFDHALVLWFPAPASFTGEDCGELHLHGGPAVIQAALEAIHVAGGIPAEAGQFTRRAFENGKMDLTEAEGLADLIDAETEGQRAQALAQMTGALKTLYEGWREDLITVLAAIEGEIDFPDEGDVPDHLAHTAGGDLARVIAALRLHLDDDHRGERVREGFTIALIGEPNAGKSSLLNALSKRDAAIVTDIPGTTRDVVEVRQIRAGFPVVLADTAGLREAADIVEAEGIRRALAKAENADLRLLVIDVSRETQMTKALTHLREGDALILNKADLAQSDQVIIPDFAGKVFRLSAQSGEGLQKLEDWLDLTVQKRLSSREFPALSRARHRHAVEAALSALTSAEAQLSYLPELAGAEVHRALRALESLTGRVDVEDVLDRVFSQFCIGK